MLDNIIDGDGGSTGMKLNAYRLEHVDSAGAESAAQHLCGAMLLDEAHHGTTGITFVSGGEIRNLF